MTVKINNKGFSLVEAILAVVIAVMVLATTTFLTTATGLDPAVNQDKASAIDLTHEGLDAVYSIRNRRWRNLDDTATTHGVRRSGGGLWEFNGTADTLGKFTRTITLADVSRTAGNIDINGTNDPQTKKVSVQTTWTDLAGRPQTYLLESYLNNWNSKKWIKDSQAEFNAGGSVHSNTLAAAGGLELNTLALIDEYIYVNSFLGSWSSGSATNVNVDAAFASSTRSSSLSALKADFAGNGVYNINHPGYDTTNKHNALNFYLNTISPFAFALYGDTGADTEDLTTTAVNAVYPQFAETRSQTMTVWPTMDQVALMNAAAGTDTLFIKTNGNFNFNVNEGLTYRNKLTYVLFTKPNVQKVIVDFTGAQAHEWMSIATNGKIDVINYNGHRLTAYGRYPVLAAGTDITFNKNANLTLDGLVYAGNSFNSQILSGVNRLTVNGPVVVKNINNNVERVNILYSSSFDSIEPKYFTPSYQNVNFSLEPKNVASPTQVNINSYTSVDSGAASWNLLSIPLADIGALNEVNLQGFTLRNNTATDLPLTIIEDMRLTGSGGSSYALSGNYTSEILNSGVSSNVLNYVTWTENLPGIGYTVRLQIRTSPDGLSWSSWCATDCTGTSYLTDYTGSQILDPSITDGVGDQYMQYKIFLTGDGNDTPTVSVVNINYSG